ncbi:MAG: nucleotidyltransferase domain-containing protein [Oscillospiraceae bacterium]|nr:nucleotidyltransferase domain-containing protein [Oscillospiraceae bacterium]
MKKMVHKIEEIAEIVHPIAENCGANKIYLFGSYARGEATENSDIDLLVDNGEAHGLVFFGFCGDLERALKTSVDVITVNSLYEEYKYDEYVAKLRAEIEKDMVMIYDRTITQAFKKREYKYEFHQF